MKTFDWILVGLVGWQIIRVVRGLMDIPSWMPADIRDRVIGSVIADQWPLLLMLLVVAYRVWG